MVRARALLGGLLVAGLLLAAPSAHAGDWIQVSCVNPNGSAASSQGWVPSSMDAGNGSSASTSCGPGSPMTAQLSTLTDDPVGAYEMLQYTPPSGSTVVGGTVDINLLPEGGGSSASAVAALFEPGLGNDDALIFCATGVSDCGTSDTHYDGVATLPSDLGGEVSVQAQCGGASGGTCSSGTNGSYSVAQVISSDIALSNDAVPAGSGFTGTLVSGPASGTAQLLFTATDPGGPGVYSVSASIAGNAVYAATPNPNGGACVPVGSDGSTLEFDGEQPCPTQTAVDIPVPTTSLANGTYPLTVTVTDAAGNTATVLNQNVTIDNPVATPPVHATGEVHARFDLTWSFSGSTTRLRAVTHAHLPRDGHVAVECLGRRCPRLTLTREGTRDVARLWRELEHVRFRSGQRLVITISQPRRRSEPIELIFGDRASPRVRLLASTPRVRAPRHKGPVRKRTR